MSKTTPNYKFIKPELNDPANIETTNPNWDTLDTELKSKASISDIDGKLADKADKTYVDDALKKKADTSAVDAKNSLQDEAIEQNKSGLSSHIGNSLNPHKVTAEQVGADPKGSANAVKGDLTKHINDKNNPHEVTTDQIGAIPTSKIGVPNGVCPLGEDGKIPLEYGGGVPITLTATTEPGATVTATDGVTTLVDEKSTGTSVFSLPNAGEWTTTENIKGDKISKISRVKDNYFVDFTRTYTVRIALNNDNPETACTYVDDAAGMVPGYNGWKNTKLFKSIKPCVVKNGVVQYYLNKNNLSQKETGEAVDITSVDTGDVMIEIPRIGYRMWQDSEYQYVSVTEEQNKSNYCYLAHSLDTEGDCDKIYIGAFLGWNDGNRLYSLSNKSPIANINLPRSRNYAEARGKGYSLVSFYPLTLLQCMYLIKYKNRNSQMALGKGRVSQSAKTNTGGTITRGEDYGEQTGKQQMCFLNIEDFWGNMEWWIDGLYSDSNRNIKTAFKNFNDNGISYPFIKESGVFSNIGSYIKTIQGTDNSGFIIKTGSASVSTYYSESGNLSGDKCCLFGGHWDSGDGSGAFSMFVGEGAEYSYPYTSARLMFKHKKEV